MTGRQTVHYFEQYAPAGVRWAVAGRNRGKLQALGVGVPVLVADSTDPLEAATLAAQTRVMLSTAGPFELFGDQLVEACVEAHTHYVDITREVAWVRSLIDRFHATAERDGTKIVPFCGFDSVPADLGVLFLRQHLGEELAEAKAYFQAKGGRPMEARSPARTTPTAPVPTRPAGIRFCFARGSSAPCSPLRSTPVEHCLTGM